MPERKYASDAHRQAAYRQRVKQARTAQLSLTQLQERGLPPLPALPTMPGYRRWRASLHQVHQALQHTLAEMQTYYDARSEAWQESERAESLQETIDALTEVLSTLEDALDITSTPAAAPSLCVTQISDQLPSFSC